MKEFRLIMYDWKEQPEWEDISDAAVNGFIYFTPVDSCGDQYAIVVTKVEVTEDEAQQMYEKELERICGNL